MTIEELDIIVQAKVKEALKDLDKIKPKIKEIVKATENSFDGIDTKGMVENLQKTTKEAKKQIDNFKKYTQQEMNVNLNSKDAKEEISQIEKEIEKLKKKISSDKLKLNLVNNSISSMKENQKADVKTRFPNSNDTQVEDRAEYELYSNEASYSKLIEQANKLNQEISFNTSLLKSANSELFKMKESYGQIIQTETKFDPNDISGMKIHIDSEEVTKEVSEAERKIQELSNKLDEVPAHSEAWNSIMNQIHAINREIQGLPPKVETVKKTISGFSTRQLYVKYIS